MGSINEVNELINQLNDNMGLFETTQYRVTETSLKNCKKTEYILHNLEADIEDGEVYFSDLKNDIRMKQLSLIGFLVESVKDIVFDEYFIQIMFDQSSIKIELIA